MKFTLQTHVKAGLARSPPDLRALGEQLARRKAESQGKLNAVGSKSIGDMTRRI